jgi:hypothetical protein
MKTMVITNLLFNLLPDATIVDGPNGVGGIGLAKAFNIYAVSGG